MAKTSPIGVRFEKDQLDFIFEREGFKSAQQVVHFLMGEYCKLYRDEKKSVFNGLQKEAPPLTPPASKKEKLEAIVETVKSKSEPIKKQVDPSINEKIKALRERKCPSYMDVTKFRQQIERDIEALLDSQK